MANPKALEFITQKLIGERRGSIDYADVVSLISNAGVPFQNQLINALRNQRIERVGDLINDLIIGDQKARAAAEAAQILADDTLTTTEIDRIFR